MATKAEIAQVFETLLWTATDDDGNPLERAKSTADFDPTLQDKARAFCDAVQETAPTIDGDRIDTDARTIHCAILDVQGHGSGLWDDYNETWKGEGKAWSKRLRDHVDARPFRDCSVYAGDDGKLYIG
jgi:hypothetical protein